MSLLIRWVIFALLIMLIGYFLPGITVAGIVPALILTLVIALINIFIRPIVDFLTLPINFLTLGLFSLVVNALLFMLAGYFVPGVEIANFWWALGASLILALLGIGFERN